MAIGLILIIVAILLIGGGLAAFAIWSQGDSGKDDR